MAALEFRGKVVRKLERGIVSRLDEPKNNRSRKQFSIPFLSITSLLLLIPNPKKDPLSPSHSFPLSLSLSVKRGFSLVGRAQIRERELHIRTVSVWKDLRRQRLSCTN